MKAMHFIAHEDDPAIPKGFAAISMNDNGWVGTNKGDVSETVLAWLT